MNKTKDPVSEYVPSIPQSTQFIPRILTMHRYRAFSNPKSRPADIAYITNFSPRTCLHAIAAINQPVPPIDYACVPTGLLPSPFLRDIPTYTQPPSSHISPSTHASSSIPTSQAPMQSGVTATALPTPPSSVPTSVPQSRHSFEEGVFDDLCAGVGGLCEFGADCPLQMYHDRARED